MIKQMGGLTMADFFSEAMGGGLKSLSPEQLEELLLRASAMREDQLRLIDNPTACKFCGSTAIVKYGKTTGGIPRMHCKDCNATFTYGQAHEFANKPLSKDAATALVIGLVENKSIRELADTMGVCESTAHRYKILMMDILAQRLADDLSEKDKDGNFVFNFNGDTQLDEYYTHLSFKGKRDPEFFIFVLERFPNHHSSREERKEYLIKNGLLSRVEAIPGYFDLLCENTDKRSKGISMDQVCTLVGVDEHGQLLVDAVSVGGLESEDALESLTGRFNSNVLMITDSHGTYPFVAEMENVKHLQIDASKHVKGGRSLSAVNSIHSEMEKFMPKSEEREVATKYLPQYWALFIWRWQHKGELFSTRVEAMRKLLVEEWERYNPDYDEIKRRPFTINTKGRFKNTDV
ncbi:MAG: IS1 family transposase [Prevotellaceae bacterium]|nr:IS1 family transposase [Candidatus Colivivens equi]